MIDFSMDEDLMPLQPRSDAQRFKSIVKAMTDTYERKNADYGVSFSNSVSELGLVAGFVPILHKCNRLKNLIKGNDAQVKEESIRDTLLDMANYCILLSMEIDKTSDLNK